MRISHEKKFVFISIPKTASTSIRKVLTPYSEVISSSEYPYYHHVTADKLKKQFVRMGWDWNSYFKFAFVRNPWDRMVSHYFHIREFVWSVQARTNGSYEEWCEKSYEEYKTLKMPFAWKLRRWLVPKSLWIRFSQEQKHIEMVWKNQLNWITDEHGESLVDYVGRYENLQVDFNTACSRIGISPQTLPRLDYDGSLLDKPKHKPYREYYSPLSCRLVEERFREDIRSFNYQY